MSYPAESSWLTFFTLAARVAERKLPYAVPETPEIRNSDSITIIRSTGGTNGPAEASPP